MLYDNFILRLYRLSTDGKEAEAKPWYQATIVIAPAGHMGGVFPLPMSPEEIASLEEWAARAVGRAQLAVPTALERPVDLGAVRRVGGKLYRALPREVRLTLEESLRRSAGRGRGLRICLELRDAPELMALPWEWLYDEEGDRFFALSQQTPIVRRVPALRPVARDPAPHPLRVLLVVAAPSDAPPFDAQAIRERIVGALSRANGSVVVETLSPPGVGPLSLALLSNSYHALHFVGHGEFDAAAEQFSLSLEDEEGKRAVLNAAQLRTLAADALALRWVVLQSCESARSAASNPWSGVAPALARYGLPAVVAMQYPLSDKAAGAFAAAWYGALAGGHPLEVALTQGRKAIRCELQNAVEWGTPVCYTAVEDTPPPPPWHERLEEVVHKGVLTTGDLLDRGGTPAALKALLLFALGYGCMFPLLYLDPADSDGQIRAAIGLGFAFTFLPALLALLYSGLPDEPVFDEIPKDQRRRLLFFKFMGAYIGLFLGIGADFLLLAVPLYYGGLGAIMPGPLLNVARILAVALLELHIYMGARRSPRISAAIFPGLPITHQEILIVLITPLLASPSMAMAFYVGAGWLLDRTFGPVLIGTAIVVIIVIEAIKSWRKAKPRPGSGGGAPKSGRGG